MWQWRRSQLYRKFRSFVGQHHLFTMFCDGKYVKVGRDPHGITILPSSEFFAFLGKRIEQEREGMTYAPLPFVFTPTGKSPHEIVSEIYGGILENIHFATVANELTDPNSEFNIMLLVVTKEQWKNAHKAVQEIINTENFWMLNLQLICATILPLEDATFLTTFNANPLVPWAVFSNIKCWYRKFANEDAEILWKKFRSEYRIPLTEPVLKEDEMNVDSARWYRWRGENDDSEDAREENSAEMAECERFLSTLPDSSQ